MIAQLSSREAQDNRAVAALFTTIGDFFSELAKNSAVGNTASRLRPIGSTIADITASFVPFSIPPCTAPQICVFVEVGGKVSDVYQVLRELCETLGDSPAEVYLLDDGTCDEAALLPLVVHNLRYARLTAETSPATRCNEAMHLVTGEVAVFIAPRLKPMPSWTFALAAFDQMSNVAAMAAQVLDENGLLLSAGAAQREGLTAPRGLGLYPDNVIFLQPGPVEAVSDEFFALRRRTWEYFGGLDEQFDNLPDALLDFCQRASAAGEAVQYEPGLKAIRLD